MAGGGWSPVRCPRCSLENPGEAQFCLHCGAQLAVSCPSCGAALPAGARFCPECGRAVAAAPAPAGYTPAHIREQILALRGAVEGERKQVTVLFCDIVASSALAAELGPEEFHRVIDRFFQVALAEVHRYGGTVNQFLGDGFMALFGAPIAHEDHARYAVLAALGIAARAEVRTRIGINSGLVVVGTIGDDLRVDYTAFGDTTVLAARLQAAAEPGAVLVSRRTAELVRGYFQLADVAPVQVKERTVYPLRVTGLGSRTARLDSEAGLSPFTGRDRELAELRRLLEIVAGGEGQVVGLAGDPGLGKSRLAWEFCQLAGETAAVLEGRCLSYGAAVAYLPLFELVRNACGIAADDAPDLVGNKIERKVKALELDVSLAHYLRHAFGLPTGDPGIAALDPAAIRARTFDALCQLLVAQSGRRPLIVLIEDLHWIDRTSEDFLAGFADELPSVPIMLLATYRPGYSPPWTGKSFTSQLALRPLSPAASEKIVASILDAGDPAAAAVAERGEGNPFFLEELARATRDRTAGTAGITVPETVQQVLAARIDRLTADQKAALQLAAVLGREFSLDLAEEVWDGDVPLEARLQELKGLEFLRERHGGHERIFVFTHALTREVAYDGMLEARRQQLHGRAGACLEDSQASQRFEHGELLAYHYARSASPARAIPYLAAAGARAKARYANEEAIRLYRKALSIVGELPAGSDRDRQELEILEAVAAPLTARYGYPSPEGQRTFERTVALAESLGSNDSTVVGLVALWQSRFVQGRTADAYQIANRALSLVGPSSRLRGQVHLIIGASALSLGRPAEGLRHLELAADLAAGPAWLITGARADIFGRAWAAHAHWLLGHDTEALSACHQAIKLARSIDHPFCLAVALAYGCITYQIGHDLPALRDAVGELRQLCDRYGFAYYREWGLILDGWSRTGEPGIGLAQQGIGNLKAEGSCARMPYWLSLLADLLAGNDRPDAARETLDAAVAAARARDDLWWLPEVMRMRAAYDEERAAISRLRSAAELASAQGSVALLRRCEHDLAGHGDQPRAPVPTT
ncbi:MAG TPA: AAA family ATPase [Streptosporangiaceae bacterium]|nr:AAA family ATPase [Streptosporangiaceae bacterium]